MTVPPGSTAMDEAPHLERQLSNRHIQLIAIGGAINFAARQRIWPATRRSAPT